MNTRILHHCTLRIWGKPGLIKTFRGLSLTTGCSESLLLRHLIMATQSQRYKQFALRLKQRLSSF